MEWLAWLNWLVAAAIAVAIVLVRGRWLTPNVYTIPLGRCDVDWHVDRGIVALTCVGRDPIKVWSLPAGQPWREARCVFCAVWWQRRRLWRAETSVPNWLLT
jgi:hypothetical protein